MNRVVPMVLNSLIQKGAPATAGASRAAGVIVTGHGTSLVGGNYTLDLSVAQVLDLMAAEAGDPWQTTIVEKESTGVANSADLTTGDINGLIAGTVGVHRIYAVLTDIEAAEDVNMGTRQFIAAGVGGNGATVNTRYGCTPAKRVNGSQNASLLWFPSSSIASQQGQNYYNPLMVNLTPGAPIVANSFSLDADNGGGSVPPAGVRITYRLLVRGDQEFEGLRRYWNWFMNTITTARAREGNTAFAILQKLKADGVVAFDGTEMSQVQASDMMAQLQDILGA